MRPSPPTPASMRSILPFLIAASLHNIGSVTGQTCGADACGTTVVPFWRSFSTGAVDHFYTASTTEFLNAANNFSYFPEGVATGVFGRQEGASVPLFRLNNVVFQDHFYTTNATERDQFIAAGYTLEGTAAWVYADGICGSHPLFRLFNPKQRLGQSYKPRLLKGTNPKVSRPLFQPWVLSPKPK